jgi:hypothetical protein
MVGSWTGECFRHYGEFSSEPFELMTGEIKLQPVRQAVGVHTYMLQLENLDLGRSFLLQSSMPESPFGGRKLPPGKYRIKLKSRSGKWVCELMEKRSFRMPGEPNLPSITLTDASGGPPPTARLDSGSTLKPPPTGSSSLETDPSKFVEEFSAQVARIREFAIEFAKVRGSDHPETKDLEKRLIALEEMQGWLAGATPEQISGFAKALTAAKMGGVLTPDEAKLLYTLRCYVGDPAVHASICRADPMLKKLLDAITEKESAGDVALKEDDLPPDVREWTRDGESMGELRFKDLVSSVVYLEDIEGYVVKVRLGELSDEDRDWIKAWKRGERPSDNACTRCKGRGLVKCLNRQCKGGVIKGKDTVTSYGPLGSASGVYDTTVGSCPTCRGTGAVKCPMCGGTGERVPGS